MGQRQSLIADRQNDSHVTGVHQAQDPRLNTTTTVRARICRSKIGDQAILRAKMLEKGKKKEPPAEESKAPAPAPPTKEPEPPVEAPKAPEPPAAPTEEPAQTPEQRAKDQRNEDHADPRR